MYKSYNDYLLLMIAMIPFNQLDERPLSMLDNHQGWPPQVVWKDSLVSRSWAVGQMVIQPV